MDNSSWLIPYRKKLVNSLQNLSTGKTWQILQVLTQARCTYLVF